MRGETIIKSGQRLEDNLNGPIVVYGAIYAEILNAYPLFKVDYYCDIRAKELMKIGGCQ